MRRGLTEILRGLLPERRLRANPRVVKRKMSQWAVKRAEHRHWPRPDPPPAETIAIVPPSKPAPVRLDLYSIT